MEEFNFTQDYETGIDVIDKQHKELFERIDALLVATYKGSEKKELEKIVEFLEGYIETHFETEEELMLKYKYSDLDKHRNEHQSFVFTFESIKSELVNKGANSYLAIRVEKEIRNWWGSHVLETDKKYVSYLKSKMA